MKKMALLLALFLASFAAGCYNSGNLVETGAERKGRIAMQHSLDCKQIPDDWDYLWLQERNSRLTQWHPIAGY